jgi:hypothetical protein
VGHVDQDAGVAVFAEFDARDAADGKTGKSQIHSDLDAFRVFGDQHQLLRGLENPACVHEVGRRPENQREQEQQQEHRLELEIPDRWQGCSAGRVCCGG